MNRNIREKISAGILGFVVGDALGVPVEFLNRNVLQKHRLVDMIGYGSHHQPEGTWSDDSSMMIATMDSIIDNNEVNFDDMMQKFCEWYVKAKYTATNEVFDIGIGTSKALMTYMNGINAIECGEVGIRNNGNGSLMRILPISIYSYCLNLTEEEEVDLINNCSALTHGHEISKLGCVIYTDYIKNILNGNNKVDALKMLSLKQYEKYYSGETIQYYKSILNGDIMSFNREQIKSTGFIVDSLEAAIWCTLKNNNYEDAVITAVNLGEDTDTIGAITGSMNGIIYGQDSIPSKWVNKLQRKEYIENIINQFCSKIFLIQDKKNNKKEFKVF